MKQFTSKTHISNFSSKSYDLEKMKRYYSMINVLKSDWMLDSEELKKSIDGLRILLEKEVVALMKKWIAIQ